MYQLTIKETHGFKTWKLNIGETLPKCPSSFHSERSELKLAAILFPDNSLKELFKTVLIESSHNYFSFQVDKLDAKNRKEETQTITIFKGMDVVPEANRSLVLHMVTGDVVSPVKRKACNHYHTPAGIVKEYMIKEWAYQDELNKALGLTAIDPEKLEELEKRAEADDVDPRFTPQKIVDALADVLSEIFPEAKVHVRKS